MVKGYWVSPDGDIYPTNNHLDFIMCHLRKFGFKKKELNFFDPHLVIEETLKRGWIRVRGPYPNLVFQVKVFSPNIFHNIKATLIRLEVPPEQTIMIEETSTRAVWYEPADWILFDEGLSYVRNPGMRNRVKPH